MMDKEKQCNEGQEAHITGGEEDKNMDRDSQSVLQCGQRDIIKQEIDEEEYPEYMNGGSQSNAGPILQCAQEEEGMTYMDQQGEITQQATSNVFVYIKQEPNEEVLYDDSENFSCQSLTSEAEVEKDMRQEHAEQGTSYPNVERCSENIDDTSMRLYRSESSKGLAEYGRLDNSVSRINLKTEESSNTDTESSHNLDLELETSEARPYICPECNRGFKKKAHLEGHMHVHSGTRPFVCSKCKKGFWRRIDLNKHYKQCNTDGAERSKHIIAARPYPCSQCDKRFKRSTHLKAHMHVHSGTRPFVCSKCKKGFWKRMVLDNHFKQCNTEETDYTIIAERPYPCSLCGKRFKTRYHLIRHYKQCHKEHPIPSNIGSRMNLQAGKTQAGKSDNTVSSQSTLYAFVCSKCKKVFWSRKNLDNHSKQCRSKHCSKTNLKVEENLGGQHDSFDNSVKSVPDTFESAPNQHTCSQCGKRFKSRYHLNRHMNVHSGYRPFECSKCKKGFWNQMDLTCHYKKYCRDDTKHSSITQPITQPITHPITHPYPCSQCGKKFKYRSLLKAHMYIHSGNRPFICSKCKKGFWKRTNLDNHYKQCHTEHPSLIDKGNKVSLQVGGSQRGQHDRSDNTLPSKVIDSRSDVCKSEAKLHPCSQCDKRFKRRSNLTTHMLDIHYKQTDSNPHTSIKWPYSCLECGRRFTRIRNLKRHMFTHSGIKTYECRNCSKSFWKQKELSLHYTVCRKEHFTSANRESKGNILAEGSEGVKCDRFDSTVSSVDINSKLGEHISEVRPHTCPECNKSFKRRSHLKAHMTIHYRNMPFACSKCKRGFWRLTELNAHFKQCQQEGTEPATGKYKYMYTSAARPYPCPECNKRFQRSTHLKRHMYTHSAKRPYVCSKCEKGFWTRKELDHHKQCCKDDTKRPSIKKPYPCSECDKRFMWRRNLKRHMFTHAGNKPFVCSKCEKGFWTRTNLRNHYKQCSSTPNSSVTKPNLCSECGKRFSRGYDVKRHMLTVHSGIKTYKCRNCNMSFGKRVELGNHFKQCCRKETKHPSITKPCSKLEKGLLSRTNLDKQYTCSQCSKRFKTRYHLNRHMNVHSGNRPLECPKCKKGFWNQSERIDHYKQCQMEKEPENKTHSMKYFQQCSKCEKQIPGNIDLTNMKVLHTTNRPYCSGYVKIQDFLSKIKREKQNDNPDKILSNTSESLSKAKCDVMWTNSEQVNYKSDDTLGYGDSGEEYNKLDERFPTALPSHEWENDFSNSRETLGNSESKERCTDNLHVDNESKETLETSDHAEECSVPSNTPRSKHTVTEDKGGNKASQRRSMSNEERGTQHLKSHESKTHTGENSRRANQALDIYLLDDMSAMKPYSCPICDKRFRHRYDLKQHHDIHTGQRPFKCSQCKDGFRRRSELLAHFKQHTGDIFICECRDTFTSEAELCIHKGTDIGQSRHKCCKCRKNFKSKEALNGHFSAHVRGLSDDPHSDVAQSDGPLPRGPQSNGPLSDCPLSDNPLSNGPKSGAPQSEDPLSEGPQFDHPLPDRPLSDNHHPSDDSLSDGPLSDNHPSDDPQSSGPQSDRPLYVGPWSDRPQSYDPLTDDSLSNGPLSDGPQSYDPLTDDPLSNGPLSDDPLSNGPLSDDSQSHEPQSHGPLPNGPQSDDPMCNDSLSDRPQTDEYQPNGQQSNGPQSNGPQSDGPRSDGPLSDRPQSDHPQFHCPQSDCPQFDCPQSDHPQTDDPKSDRPESHGPQSDSPQSNGPQSDRPQFDHTQSHVPQFEESQYDRPRSDGPLSDRPQSDCPPSDGPLSDCPQSDCPLSDGPLSDCLQSDHPQSDRDHPQSYGPQFNGPQSDCPQSDFPSSDRPQSHDPQFNGPQSDDSQSDCSVSDEPQSHDLQSNGPQSDDSQSDNPQSDESQFDCPHSHGPLPNGPQSDDPMFNDPLSDHPQTDESQPNGQQSNGPQSNGPQSDGPRFNHPQSDFPQSDHSQSDCPQSDCPPSDRPQSHGPQFNGPQYDDSQSDHPQSDCPPSDRPQSHGPQFNGPQYDDSQSDDPQSDCPPSDRPQSHGPQFNGPQYDDSQSDHPQSDCPPSDFPQSHGPQFNGPQYDDSQSDDPQSDDPQSDCPQSDRSVSDEPQSHGPQSNSPQSDDYQSNNPQSDESHFDCPLSTNPRSDGPQVDDPQSHGPQFDCPLSDGPLSYNPRSDRPQLDDPVSYGPLSNGNICTKNTDLGNDASETSLEAGECNVASSFNSNIHRHIQYSCPECSKQFCTQHYLIRHMYKHIAENGYQCSQCEKRCRSKYDLGKHIREQHTGERPYQCHKCGSRFYAMGDMNKHLKNVHFPFLCEICGKNLSADGLLSHLKIHERESPYSCPDCGSGFASKTTLSKHLIICTGAYP